MARSRAHFVAGWILLGFAALAGIAFAGANDGTSPASQANPAWVQLAKLSSSSPYASANSVAISGNIIVVGQPYGQFASVYVMPGDGWGNMVETATLTASDELPCGFFGNSVSISGDTILVGDPETLCYPAETGAAYVFVRPAGGWHGTLTQTAKLTASDAVAGDNVGYSVAIDGDNVIVGAPYQSSGAGSAYIFAKPTGGWVNETQTAKLTASDGASNDKLGTSVSINGMVAVAGSPSERGGTNSGGVYVYAEPSGGWTNATQTAKLTALDTEAYVGLGVSVAIKGQTVVAGAPYATIHTNQERGAVYVFVEPAGGWVDESQTAKLTASNGHPDDLLGTSVATNGGLIVSGAPCFSLASNRQTSPFFCEGALYVFARPPGGWVNQTQSAMITGSDARYAAYLGTSAAIEGITPVAGASFSTIRNRGAAYVFRAFSGQ